MEERNGFPGSEPTALVATEARPIERSERPLLPIPARAATGGVVLAAATWMLVRILRRPARRQARGAVRFGRGRNNRVEIAGSRSFLVDVHVLKR